MRTFWTIFYDCYADGYRLTPYSVVVIQASHQQAIKFFHTRFKRNPLQMAFNRVMPTYRIHTIYDTLENATNHERFDLGNIAFLDFAARLDVCIITDHEIKESN